MSCGRICKTDPCTFPACVPAAESMPLITTFTGGESSRSFMETEGYRAILRIQDALAADPRIQDALMADPHKQYTEGYSDGYDDALRDTGDGVAWYVMAGAWVWGALIGFAAGWAWL